MKLFHSWKRWQLIALVCVVLTAVLTLVFVLQGGGGDTQPHAASAIGYYFTAQPNTVVDISAVFEKKFEAIALHDSQMDAQTLAMYRVYFGMKGKEQAAGKNFALGEGLKVLSPLHAHCFVDAARI